MSSSRSKPMILGAAIAVAIVGTLTVAQPLTASPAPQQVPQNFTVSTPNRVLDTRQTGRLSANQVITVQTGLAGVIAAGVNITLVETGGGLFLTAWQSGNRPNTSVINSDRAGQTIANYVVVPTTSSGSFQLYTSGATHVLVDVVGGYTAGGGGGGGTTPPPSGTGFVAVITGYSPGFSITTVVGTVTNNSGTMGSIRMDVRCPNNDLETTTKFNMPPGETLGWTVICNGVFNSGATVTTVKV